MADDGAGVWTKVASRGDVADGAVIGVKPGGVEIALYNLGGEFFATSGLCTHAWALMSQGYVEEGQFIDCPIHFARFEIKTGKAICAPAERDLDTYKVRLSGDDVEILLPAA